MFEAPRLVSAVFAVLMLTPIIYGGIIWVNMIFFPKNVHGDKRRRHKTYPVAKPNPRLRTVVIRCYDRRFPVANRRFIIKELGLRGRDFYPVKVAGGPAGLARPSQLPAEYETLMTQIGTAAANHVVTKIVLIAHEDCGRYKKLGLENPHIGKEDLPLAAKNLKEEYPDAEILAYYARFTPKRKRIYFEEVTTEAKAEPPAETAENNPLQAA